MSTDYQKLAGSLMGGNNAEELEKNAEAIQRLAKSEDGQKVKNLIGDERKLASALENGDTEALKNMVNTILSTAEGARLAEQLSGLLK